VIVSCRFIQLCYSVRHFPHRSAFPTSLVSLVLRNMLQGVDSGVGGTSSSSSSSCSPDELMRRSVTPGNLRSPQHGIASASSWTLFSQTLRGRPGGLLQLAIGFLPSYRYPAPDAEHHVLVLQGPGVQHGQTEISVNDQRLSNQIAEAPLHWRHEPGTGPGKCGVKWRLLSTSPKASSSACCVHAQHAHNCASVHIL